MRYVDHQYPCVLLYCLLQLFYIKLPAAGRELSIPVSNVTAKSDEMLQQALIGGEQCDNFDCFLVEFSTRQKTINALV